MHSRVLSMIVQNLLLPNLPGQKLFILFCMSQVGAAQ